MPSHNHAGSTGSAQTTDTAPQPEDTQHWRDEVTVPVHYLGLRRLRVTLPEPAPEHAIQHARRACFTHHHRHCWLCHLARPAQALLLCALILSTMTITAAAATSAPFPDRLLDAGILVTIVTGAALTLATAAAALHRRHMPMEMMLRVANAARAPQHTNSDPTDPTAPTHI